MNKFNQNLVTENILLEQAARMETELGISSSMAHNLLAKCFYDAQDWEALLTIAGKDSACVPHTRRDTNDHEGSRQWQVELKRIAWALAQNNRKKTDLPSLASLVHYVFTNEHQTFGPQDFLPGIAEPKWESALVGPDPAAVLHARIELDGLAFILIATRIFHPDHQGFVEDPRIYIDDFWSCFSEALQIMWSKPFVWREAARQYLLPVTPTWANEEDCEGDEFGDIDFEPPCEVLDAEMQAHAKWFKSALHAIGVDNDITSHDENSLLPIMIDGQTYIAFGFPNDVLAERAKIQLTNASHRSEEMDSTLRYLGFSNICIETSLLAAMIPPPPSLSWIKISADLRMHVRGNMASIIRPATRHDVTAAMTVPIERKKGETVIEIKTLGEGLLENVIRIADTESVCEKPSLENKPHWIDISPSSSPDDTDTQVIIQCTSDEWISYQRAFGVCIHDVTGSRQVAVETFVLNLVRAIGAEAFSYAWRYGQPIRIPTVVYESLIPAYHV